MVVVDMVCFVCLLWLLCDATPRDWPDYLSLHDVRPESFPRTTVPLSEPPVNSLFLIDLSLLYILHAARIRQFLIPLPLSRVLRSLPSSDLQICNQPYGPESRHYLLWRNRHADERSLLIDVGSSYCSHQLALAVSCPLPASPMAAHLSPLCLDSIPPDPRLSFLPTYATQRLGIPTIIQYPLWEALVCFILNSFNSIRIQFRLGNQPEPSHLQLLRTSIQRFWCQSAHDHKPGIQRGTPTDSLAIPSTHTICVCVRFRCVYTERRSLRRLNSSFSAGRHSEDATRIWEDD